MLLYVTTDANVVCSTVERLLLVRFCLILAMSLLSRQRVKG